MVMRHAAKMDQLELNLRRESCCASNVVFQQAAKRFVADNVFQPKVFDRIRRRKVEVDGHVAETLMRSELVVVDEPRREDMP